MEGSSKQTYKEFKELPIRSFYEKSVISWVDKN